MEDKHLKAELVSLWLDREVTDRDVLKLVLPHVVADCPTCGLAWKEGTRGRIPGVGLFAALHHELSGETANAKPAFAPQTGVDLGSPLPPSAGSSGRG